MGDYQKNKEQPFASIVICTRSRKECLQKYSLPSVLNLSYPHYEVIVVYDDSKDGSEEFLDNYKDPSGRLKVIKNRMSNGIAHARNLGAHYAQGEIVAFTDDDCLVDVNWLSEFVGEFIKNANLMATGGFTYDGYSDKPNLPANGIFGFNMAFRKEVFGRFLFDTNLFFHKGPYHEETDLVNRMRGHGYMTGYVPKAVVRHFYAPASYRRINQRISCHLNWIYMNAKSLSLPRYYYKFFKRSYQMFHKIKALYKEGAISFSKALLKIGWVNYVLLFELPLKAKKTHYREEKIFKLGTAANRVNNEALKSSME
jgi:GT2 family glycosyltransferase